jgi:hypothetical protein
VRLLVLRTNFNFFAVILDDDDVCIRLLSIDRSVQPMARVPNFLLFAYDDILGVPLPTESNQLVTPFYLFSLFTFSCCAFIAIPQLFHGRPLG